MKKVIWITIFLLFVFVSGCGNNDEGNSSNESETNNQVENNEDNENENENETTDKDDNDLNEGQDSEEDMESDENQDENTDDETVTATYKIDQDTWSVVPIDDAANKDVLLLTIDDAPDKHALEMAHTLKDLGANAIFFVNGHFLETDEEKETLKEIHDMGFLIGNHTYSHAYLPDISPEKQREEIIKVNDMVEDIIGERPAFFRAPNGANTDTSTEVAEEEDMVFMNWSYGYDFKEEYMSKDAITDIMLNTELLHSGSNLLMHDRDWTNAALEDIITGLRDKGYKMVDPALIETKK